MSESSDIAVIGLALRVPGASTLDEFWELLVAGRETVRDFSNVTLDAEARAYLHWAGGPNPPTIVRAGALLDDVAGFDAAFFGFSPREAALLDPQHRHFFEVAWHALEDAAFVPARSPAVLGVFASCGLNAYFAANLMRRPSVHGGPFALGIGNDKDFVASRLAYLLNARGPAVMVQTACSASLVAIHQAVQSLLAFECDAALAGGVSLPMLAPTGYPFEQGSILSRDGHCRPFSQDANGTVPGCGAGAVVLKRLEDAQESRDPIRAIIRASAINNDGRDKVSYTAPSVRGQYEVILAAHALAEIDAASIGFVEAHGTGTELGDPIEVEALTRAFRASTQERGFCALGAVKANIGHLDAAAGVAGFIKAVLVLQRRTIPPLANFSGANPRIPFADSPFFVPSEARSWISEGPRCAGVSSFGIGGTNAHVLLEEAASTPAGSSSERAELFFLSSRSEAALRKSATILAEHLRRHPELPLGSVASTLWHGREHYHERAIVVASTREALLAGLARVASGQTSAGEDDARLSPLARRILAGESVDAAVPPSPRISLPGYAFQHERHWIPFELESLMPSRLPPEHWLHRVSFRVLPHVGARELRDVRFMVIEDSRGFGGRLVQALRALGARVENDVQGAHVIFAAGLTSREPLLEGWHCARSWLGASRPERITWLSQGAHRVGEEPGHASSAALAAFARVFANEHPSIRSQLLDLDPTTSIEDVVRALQSDDADEVALRHGLRLARSYEPLGEENSVPRPLRDGAHYVITGGTGGLGGWLTTYILERAPHANVTAIGRHPPSSSRASFVQADVADAASLGAGWECARAQHGPIDGVFHLAGVSPWTPIASTDEDQVRAAFAAKVEGLRNLDHLLAARPADFLVAFSSLSAHLGDPGFFAYAAANAAMEATLHELRSGTPTLAIAWDAWRGIGMTAKLAPNEHAITPDEAGPVLERAMHSSASCVLVSTARLPPERTAAKSALDPRPAAVWITEVWQALLGVDSIALDDDFHALGGHSLLAVALAAALRERSGVEVSVAQVLNATTVAAQSVLIDGLRQMNATPRSGDVLVELRAGRGAPIYFPHALGGTVSFYRALIGALRTERPCIGVQSPTIDGNGVRMSLGEMAESYARDVFRHQPHGPYAFVGASMGGVIGLEIARRALECDERVELLVMLDSPAPAQLSGPLGDATDVLAYFLDIESPARARERLCAVSNEDRFELFQRLARERNHPLGALSTEHLARFVAVFLEQENMLLSHRPEPYPGSVLFYRARQRDANNPVHPEEGWQSLVRALEVVEVEGNHHTMLTPPHVDALAADLSRRLCPEH